MSLIPCHLHKILYSLELSRSRPYQKNDNRNVEQKNSTQVRAFLGYDRLDTVEQTQVLNVLYDKMWLYYNFFQPVMHMTAKVVTPIKGRHPKIKRTHDAAKTPFDRLCLTNTISDADRQKLQQLRAQTNPRRLRQEIYILIDYIFTLPPAVPSMTEDVYETSKPPQTLPKGVDIPVTLSFARTIALQ